MNKHFLPKAKGGTVFKRFANPFNTSFQIFCSLSFPVNGPCLP